MARPRTLCDIKIGLKAAAFSITLARGHHLFYGQLVNPMKSHFRRLRSNWLPKGREESNVDSFFLEPKGKPKSLIHHRRSLRDFTTMTMIHVQRYDTLETRNGFSNLRLFLFARPTFLARLFYLFFDPHIGCFTICFIRLVY